MIRGRADAHRITCALIAAGAVAAVFASVRDAPARTSVLYWIVLPLAYGHLIGAFPKRRDLELVFVLTGVAALFAAYTLVVNEVVLAVMAAISVWHVVENELARTRVRDPARLGPLPRATFPHLAAATVAAATLATAWLGVAGVDAWLAFGIGFHAISWIAQAGARVRSLRAAGESSAAGRIARRVAVVHLVPCLIGAAVAAAPDSKPAGWFFTVSSPAVFFFFSALHALQTAWTRGLERGSS